MSVSLDLLLSIVSNLVIIILCIRFIRKNNEKSEHTIALISAVAALFMYIFSDIRDDEQRQELVDIHKNQIDTLQTSLSLEIQRLKLSNDSIGRRLTECQNNTYNPQVKGNGNIMPAIIGSDGSNIYVNANEKPAYETKLDVGELTHTAIEVHTGEKIFISATGSIKVGEIVGHSGPGGKEGGLFNYDLSPYNIVPGFKHAALMFKLADADDWIECGAQYKFTANKNGKLIFDVNDNNQRDNTGAYQVSVEIYR